VPLIAAYSATAFAGDIYARTLQHAQCGASSGCAFASSCWTDVAVSEECALGPGNTFQKRSVCRPPCDYGLTVRGHGQIEDSQRVARQRGELVHRWVLPHVMICLRVPRVDTISFTFLTTPGCRPARQLGQSGCRSSTEAVGNFRLAAHQRSKLPLPATHPAAVSRSPLRSDVARQCSTQTSSAFAAQDHRWPQPGTAV
jgi:hypothetical protein